MRSHFYQIKHVPQTTPPNPGAMLNFQVGFLWEELVESGLKYARVLYKAQEKLTDEELNVEGTLDFMLQDSDGSWEVVDSKTESVYSDMYRKREKSTFLEAHPEYVMQVGTYILLLKRKGYDVKRGRFLVITKDNGMMKEFFVEFTPGLEAKILHRIELLNKYLTSNMVPPCECEGWKVGYCNYGRPSTRHQNTTKKWVNQICCGNPDQMKEWAKEEMAEKGI